MDSQEFLGNILAGFTGSIITFIFVNVWHWYSYKRKFSKLNGKYTHHSVIDGNRIDDWITELRHVKGRIISSKSVNPQGKSWEGRITMSEDVPEFGTGIYQYKDKEDCGLHQIQLNNKGNTIYVNGRNTSHGKEYTFAYLWKKMEPTA